ncbi:hypothetical protein [Luteimonas granuli]|uniref:Uncharacterized protein n=1 Tax=Luteimonas granuli TaxID=1176533 RepID=A0A518N354_9GAMM|nr:hypothetical protein [Luteimonas granuli]QDW66350.1 hypothetical protein FPZ22_05110 [Luteimonas granuli]
MARELCLFLSVDAGKVPEKKRQPFLETTVRRAAPFSDPAFGVAWSGPRAAVWYWSQSRVLELLGGERPRRLRFVPEALLTGATTEAGAELLTVSSGFEGRIWKAHHPVASRCWGEPPSAQDWHAFLRGAGLPAEGDVPPPQPAPVADAPWSSSGHGRATPLAGIEQFLPRIALGAGALFLLASGFQLGSIMRAAVDTARARQAAATLDEPLARILDARQRADAHAVDIEQLLALRGQPSQLRLLAEAGQVMQGRDWQMRMWHQPVPERIEAIISMPQPDPEFLVTVWEASPLFQDVATELSRQQNEVTLRANITTDAAAEAAP